MTGGILIPVHMAVHTAAAELEAFQPRCVSTPPCLLRPVFQRRSRPAPALKVIHCTQCGAAEYEAEYIHELSAVS